VNGAEFETSATRKCAHGKRYDEDCAECEADSSDIVCPFCQEGDFDLIGLKAHYLRGYCQRFNDTGIL